MDQAILDDLRRDYEAGNLIVFVGAGVSAGAGIPGWKRLAEILLEDARKSGADAGALGEIEEHIRTNRLVDALSGAKLVLGKEFERTVRKQLDDAGRAVPPAAQAIAALGPKLRAVLTTNLDRLLERAFGGEWKDLTDPTGDITQQRAYILKLHGTLHDASTWVFLRDQYDRAMFRSQKLQRTIKALYQAFPILFVGFGLADDNIDLTLGEVRALSDGQPPSHYALMPAGMGPLRKRTLEDAGLRLLLYTNADGRHGEVVDVLRSLAAHAPPSPPTAAGPPPLPDPMAPAATPIAPRKAPAGPLEVFFCYAPRDKELLERLQVHMAPLRRTDKLLSTFHEGEVHAGADRDAIVNEHLERADLILLLISPDFLASERNDAQVTRAMERHAAGTACVIPILLRPCEWETSPFARLQMLPRKDRTDKHVPVVMAPNEDEAFARIVAELRVVLKGLRGAP